MNKKIMNIKNNKLGKGSPVLIDKENKIGKGVNSVLLEERKEDLMIGKGVILNKPITGRRKPLKLNI